MECFPIKKKDSLFFYHLYRSVNYNKFVIRLFNHFIYKYPLYFNFLAFQPSSFASLLATVWFQSNNWAAAERFSDIFSWRFFFSFFCMLINAAASVWFKNSTNSLHHTLWFSSWNTSFWGVSRMWLGVLYKQRWLAWKKLIFIIFLLVKTWILVLFSPKIYNLERSEKITYIISSNGPQDKNPKIIRLKRP